MAHSAALGDVYGQTDIRPTCTFVEVKGFIKQEWLVEREVDGVAQSAAE